MKKLQTAGRRARRSIAHGKEMASIAVMSLGHGWPGVHRLSDNAVVNTSRDRDPCSPLLSTALLWRALPGPCRAAWTKEEAIKGAK